MLDPHHVRTFVIIPALAAFPEPWRTPAAVELLLGTALKESRLEFLKQGLRRQRDGRGRALGLWQMEVVTFQDHCRWLRSQPHIQAIIFPHGHRPAKDMIWDLFLAARMARVHYWCRGRTPLPACGDVDGMARYWGKYYQTQSIPEAMDQFCEVYTQHALASAPKV